MADENVVRVNLQERAVEQEKEINDTSVTKVDLRKPAPEPTEDIVDDIVDTPENPDTPPVEDTTEEQEDLIIEEIVDTDDIENPTVDQPKTDIPVEPEPDKGPEFPEGIQKLVDFMNDTGGTLEDYIKLNKDFDKLSEDELLREFYRAEEPGLSDEEIDFLIEDTYGTEDLDSEREIKKKEIARKRDVNKAKKILEDQKAKYYEDLKAGSKLTPDQKKAVDFFNRYNKEQTEVESVTTQRKQVFQQKSEELFSNDFKGFEYNIGDKRFRYNVKNVADVKQAQSNINNFAKKFLGENDTLKDAAGYHKALFTANNADAIANHFYEQGRADAIKAASANSKNIDMNPRKAHGKPQNTSGMQVRAVESKDIQPGKLRIKT